MCFWTYWYMYHLQTNIHRSECPDKLKSNGQEVFLQSVMTPQELMNLLHKTIFWIILTFDLDVFSMHKSHRSNGKLNRVSESTIIFHISDFFIISWKLLRQYLLVGSTKTFVFDRRIITFDMENIGRDFVYVLTKKLITNKKHHWWLKSEN